jgi:hypothetical protein
MIDLPVIWVALAVVAGIVIVRKLRSRRPRATGSTARSGLIDVEADLVDACHGDRAMVERLISHELAQNESLSRTGAALMALAKLRDDRR